MGDKITFAENSKAEALVKRIDEEREKGTISDDLVIYWLRYKIHDQDNVFVYNEYPDYEVEFDDLVQIKDEISYAAVIKKVLEKQKTPLEKMADSVSNPAPTELMGTRDMLAPTVIMDPVDPNATVETKEETTDTVEEPSAPSTVTPEVQTMANKQVKKPLTLANKPKANSQAGFAEVIALAVVVLVYVVIIVNLIIRLK